MNYRRKIWAKFATPDRVKTIGGFHRFAQHSERAYIFRDVRWPNSSVSNVKRLHWCIYMYLGASYKCLQIIVRFTSFLFTLSRYKLYHQTHLILTFHEGF